MKNIKKLQLSRETVRLLGGTELHHANGGLSGRRCTAGRTGCGECTPHDSIGNSLCDVCLTEVDCATGAGGCFTFEPGCAR
jgi:hypothetical protein